MRSPRAVWLVASMLSMSTAMTGGSAEAQIVDRASDFMGSVFGPPDGTGRPAHQHERRSPTREKAQAPSDRDKTQAAKPPAEDATPAPVPVPSSDPRDAEPARAIEPQPAEAGSEADANRKAQASEPVAEPAKSDVVQPEPAEAKPVEEIPVPEDRPAVPAEAVTPPTVAPVPAPAKPVEGQAGVEPARPQDAPNSTENLKSREPTIDPATAVVAAAAVEDARQCEAELKKRGAVFEVKPSISEGECGVLRPVAFERSSSGVAVGPNTQMLCRTALALDIWLSDVVAAEAKADFPDRKLTEFRQASTYVCRPRASESGISEHARGSAIDIGAFVFDKGAEIGVAAHAADSPEQRFMDKVRAGACGPFKTVLGPGTDADHATHFHLDIAARRNGATYCK